MSVGRDEVKRDRRFDAVLPPGGIGCSFTYVYEDICYPYTNYLCCTVTVSLVGGFGMQSLVWNRQCGERGDTICKYRELVAPPCSGYGN